MFLIVIVGVRCSDAFGAGPRLVSYRKYLTESILAPFVPVSFPQGTPRALSWPRSWGGGIWASWIKKKAHPPAPAHPLGAAAFKSIKPSGTRGSNISNISNISSVSNRYSGYIGNQMLFGWVTQVALSLGIHLAVAGGARPIYLSSRLGGSRATEGWANGLFL